MKTSLSKTTLAVLIALLAVLGLRGGLPQEDGRDHPRPGLLRRSPLQAGRAVHQEGHGEGHPLPPPGHRLVPEELLRPAGQAPHRRRLFPEGRREQHDPGRGRIPGVHPDLPVFPVGRLRPVPDRHELLQEDAEARARPVQDDPGPGGIQEGHHRLSRPATRPRRPRKRSRSCEERLAGHSAEIATAITGARPTGPPSAG